MPLFQIWQARIRPEGPGSYVQALQDAEGTLRRRVNQEPATATADSGHEIIF